MRTFAFHPTCVDMRAIVTGPSGLTQPIGKMDSGKCIHAKRYYYKKGVEKVIPGSLNGLLADFMLER